MLEDEKAPVSQLQPMPRGKTGRTITTLDAAPACLSSGNSLKTCDADSTLQIR
jgi:hypothetical protein